MGITETGIPDCTVELMHGNSATSAVSAVVTCPDLTEIYELARLARSMVVRVPSHASKTNTAFRRGHGCAGSCPAHTEGRRQGRVEHGSHGERLQPMGRLQGYPRTRQGASLVHVCACHGRHTVGTR